MTSACIAFSTCRIQFTTNDRQRDDREYSERSLLELRQYDFANFSLRALDIENNREEIFAVPLENENQYKRGQSANVPDEIRTNAGTYRLWLNTNSRDNFYKLLNAAIEEVKLISNGSPDSPPVAASKPTTRDDRDSYGSNARDDRDRYRSNSRDKRDSPKPTRRDDRDRHRSNSRDKRDSFKPTARDDRDRHRSNSREKRNSPKPTPRDDRDRHRSDSRDKRDSPKPTPRDDRDSPASAKQSDRVDIVADVYQLGEYIRRGRTDDAANLAKKLSKQHVHLQAKSVDNAREEKSISIRVKIDSNNRDIANQRKEQTLAVYPSTTIAELRATFECSEKHPPIDQYFFVNGHLAHEKSTMEELNVTQNLLFILFVIKQ